jgi:hypothetical protein
MPKLLPCPHWKAVCLFGVLLASTRVASAQALETAQRGAEIAPFVQTTYLKPDWGPTNNIGFTVGVDYTRFIRSIVQPSLEARFTNAGGSTVGEHSFSGGLKLQTSIRNVHPYFTLLAGEGIITFTHPANPNYTSDNSVIYSFGGGLAVTVHSQWDVRLDFTQQEWNLGGSETLSPTTYGVGIAYRLPFHNGGVH